MTPLQTAEVRAGAIRIRLAELAALETYTDENRSELDTLRNEYTDVERRLTALRISDTAPAPLETRFGEGREFRALLNKANVGAMFDSIIEHRAMDGAEAEIQQHYHLPGNQIPLAMLRRTWGTDDDLEKRAATPAPANVGQNQNSILPYVFPQAAATFLGVDMPSVGVGEAVYPVLTSELTVGTPAENAAQAETDGVFSADVLSPSRIQASFRYSREDRSRFAGMDEALRMNLSEGLADGLDEQIISGTNGLLTGTNLANHNVTTVTSYADFISDFAYDRVDGRYASMTSDLRIVMGSGAYAHAASLYRGNNADQHALGRLMFDTAGVRVSAHVPAVASNRQNSIIRLGMDMSMVAPVWEGVTIIPDEVTKAAEGQIVITAVMLHAVKLLRAGGWYKQQTQHA